MLPSSGVAIIFVHMIIRGREISAMMIPPITTGIKMTPTITDGVVIYPGTEMRMMSPTIITEMHRIPHTTTRGVVIMEVLGIEAMNT